ncbi:MAG: hypothetical protein Q4E64_03825 [Phascolarctobacterium sp.]|uniref:hypothetical protein n=1 Tax=Phascolarctobacterium sp. TaxID=2049039 RepID=UPI0026DCA21B|nr:hypothetical protein [Phascolarctobacterium sp.]MDO4920942.1 hypothetical protein [Phascolarctobacterium sp.]
MTKDELKKKLKSAAALQRQLESDCAQLQNLRDIANNVTPKYGPRAGGSGNGQKIENAVVNIVDLEADIQQDMNNLVAAMNEVRQLIALVGDKNLEVILHKRYLNYQKWEQIAGDMGYSWRGVHKLHSKALDIILEKDDGRKTKRAKPRKANGVISRKSAKAIFEEQKLF